MTVCSRGDRTDAPEWEITELSSSVDAEPVEDGMRHPAEPALADFVERHGAQKLLAHAFGQGMPGARSAALLRLLGRVPSVDEAARHELVEHGLASANVELRDAALQAAESWEDASLAELLRAHRDPVPWLADYAARVARDLAG